MRNILFVAHDPGGANVIKPVIEHFAEQKFDEQNNIHSFHLLLGPAASRIESRGESVSIVRLETVPTPNFPNELSVRENDVERLFQETRFDAVFTATSFNSNLERLCILHANALHIPTFAILDFWSNYRQRFTYEGRFDAPSVLFVADKRMEREAREALPSTEVVISGNPNLLSIAARYKHLRQPHQSLTPNRIRFFCENIRHYYPDKPVNEFTVVPHLLKGLRDAGFGGELLIRPHPMESREPWLEWIAATQATTPLPRLALDTATFDEVLRDDCVAVGFTTMALLETASVGIPTFSYQVNVPAEYFNLPFEEYEITRLLSESDVAGVLQPPEQIDSLKASDNAALAIIHETLNKKIAGA